MPNFMFFSFQARLEINDLFVDVGDGILLIKLLEIISGEKVRLADLSESDYRYMRLSKFKFPGPP